MSETKLPDISEMKAESGEDGLKYFRLPDARVIGKSMRCPLDRNAPNPIPAFWGKCIDEGLLDIVKTPARLMPAMLGFTDDFDAKTNTFLYIVGALFPAGTPVPEGCASRDIPATVVARGAYGKWLDDCRPLWEADGYERSGAEGQSWNSELYLDNESTDGFRLLCAVKEK
jgi:hypothetical protein